MSADEESREEAERRADDDRRNDDRRKRELSVEKDKRRFRLDNRTGTFRRTGLERRFEFPFFKKKTTSDDPGSDDPGTEDPGAEDKD